MLRRLRIRNFKAWKDTGEIRMAPITLFFGANSSGKSSIGQFLMMLKQTVESPDRKAVFYPGGRNSAVQLGSYQEMVFRRDPANRIAFHYEWTLPEALRVNDPIEKSEFVGDSLFFEAEVGLHGEAKQVPTVSLFHYDLKGGDGLGLSVSMTRKRGSGNGYEVEAKPYKLKRKQGRPWAPGAPVRFYGFPDEVVAYYQNADFVQDLNLRHENLFRSIIYLGPLRTKPERLYSWTGVEPDSVGYAGENTIAAMLAARNRKLSFGYKHKAMPFDSVIASKLKEMKLIEDFHVRPISEQRQEYEVKVKTWGSKDFVDLPDVGFGMSQVLPVLVQAFYAQEGSILLVEQPEIHLHPSAQSDLADVMIDVIRSRENGKYRKVQLVIETHSEHFLRRLLRRIAEERISHDDVSAYFANLSRAPVTLDPLEIDMFGNVQNWPEYFFGDEMGDITAHAKAALSRRRDALPSSVAEECE